MYNNWDHYPKQEDSVNALLIQFTILMGVSISDANKFELKSDENEL